MRQFDSIPCFESECNHAIILLRVALLFSLRLSALGICEHDLLHTCFTLLIEDWDISYGWIRCSLWTLFRLTVGECILSLRHYDGHS